MNYIKFRGVIVPVLPNIRGGPCTLDYCIESSEVEITIRHRSAEVTRSDRDGEPLPVTTEVLFDVVLDGTFHYPGRLLSRTRDVMFTPDLDAYVAVSNVPAGHGISAEMEPTPPGSLKNLILETGYEYLGRSGACSSLGQIIDKVLTARVKRAVGGLQFVG